jgi:hypothetical protein
LYIKITMQGSIPSYREYLLSKGTLLCQIIEAVKAWLSNIICKLT